jgi:hypothetical protein
VSNAPIAFEAAPSEAELAAAAELAASEERARLEAERAASPATSSLLVDDVDSVCVFSVAPYCLVYALSESPTFVFSGARRSIVACSRYDEGQEWRTDDVWY